MASRSYSGLICKSPLREVVGPAVLRVALEPFLQWLTVVVRGSVWTTTGGRHAILLTIEGACFIEATPMLLLLRPAREVTTVLVTQIIPFLSLSPPRKTPARRRRARRKMGGGTRERSGAGDLDREEKKLSVSFQCSSAVSSPNVKTLFPW